MSGGIVDLRDLLVGLPGDVEVSTNRYGTGRVYAHFRGLGGGGCVGLVAEAADWAVIYRELGEALRAAGVALGPGTGGPTGPNSEGEPFPGWAEGALGPLCEALGPDYELSEGQVAGAECLYCGTAIAERGDGISLGCSGYRAHPRCLPSQPAPWGPDDEGPATPPTAKRTGTCPYCDHAGEQPLYVDSHGDRDAECTECGACWPIGPAPDNEDWPPLSSRTGS